MWVGSYFIAHLSATLVGVLQSMEHWFYECGTLYSAIDPIRNIENRVRVIQYDFKTYLVYWQQIRHGFHLILSISTSNLSMLSYYIPPIAFFSVLTSVNRYL